MTPLAVYTDTDDLDPQAGIDLLIGAGFEVVRLETHDSNEIVNAARDAVALLVGYAQITGSMLEAMPQLEVISMLSTGSDNIDHAAVADRGIELVTLGALPAQEVATHTAAITLSMLRGVSLFQDAAKRLEWFKTPYPVLPPRVSDLTLGVLGFGQIGRLVGTYLLPLFGSVNYHDPFLQSSDDSRFNSVSFEELIQSSDVLSINIPATPENKHLFNAQLFSKMKKGSFLVNTSRGSLVDSDALAAALAQGQLAGAALDVIDGEPAKAGNPLLNNEKVLLTPHVGYLSEYTNQAYITVQAQNAINFFKRKRGQ